MALAKTGNRVRHGSDPVSCFRGFQFNETAMDRRRHNGFQRIGDDGRRPTDVRSALRRLAFVFGPILNASQAIHVDDDTGFQDLQTERVGFGFRDTSHHVGLTKYPDSAT